jgi:hypothetical protein
MGTGILSLGIKWTGGEAKIQNPWSYTSALNMMMSWSAA